MKKTKSFQFAVFSIICVCMMSILTIMYIFSISFDSITGGKAEEIFAVWPYDYESNANNRQQKIQVIIQKTNEWAEEKQASILLKPLDGVGAAIADYSGWLEENYGIVYLGEEKTALVKKGTRFEKLFVEDGVLFPDTYGYQVVGTYGDSIADEVAEEELFFYSLSDYQSGEWDLGCLMHIYAEDERIVNSLVHELENMGVTVSFVDQSDNVSGVGNAFLQILVENRSVRCMLVLLASVWFCVALSVSLFYRCTKKNLRIAHLYGATYAVLFRKIGLQYGAAALIGIMLGFLLGSYIFDISDIAGVMKISIKGSILMFLIVAMIQIINYLIWYFGCEKKGGRY